MTFQILTGDNRELLKSFPDNHFDSIVTDPPYGIDFLGKDWDANTGALETYQECLRVLKPGGHILAFSAARTYHHLAVTIEQAGFEIRDQIMWIYSSGFPKSQDVGRQIHKKLNGKPDKQRFDPSTMIKEGDHFKHPATHKLYRALLDINGDKLARSHEGQGYGVVYEEIIEVDNEWSGWGTALKPAHEPIVLARKPLDKNLSIARNCQQWDVGALNIDACRVPWGEDDDPEAYIAWDEKYPASTGSKAVFNNAHADAKGVDYVRDQDADINLDRDVDNRMAGRFPSNVIGEISGYQKYFYCPKVSRAERHIGFDNLPPVYDRRQEGLESAGIQGLQKLNGEKNTAGGNNHPTVKPIELMKYLIKLVTPPGGHVLDPFNGSGSTGCAAVELDYDYTGIELDPAYVVLAEKRIAAWYAHTHSTTFDQVFELC